MARLPATATLRSLGLALFLAAVLLTGWEHWLRELGQQAHFTTQIQDTVLRLEQPAADEQRRLLIFGSSRVRHGIDPSSVNAGAGPRWDARNLGVGGGTGALQLHLALSRIEPGDAVVVEVFPSHFYQDLKSGDFEDFEAKETRLARLNLMEAAIHEWLRENLYLARTSTSPVNEARRQARAAASMGQVEDQIFLEGVTYVVHPDGWLEHIQPESGPVYHHDRDAGGAKANVIFPFAERERARDAVLERLARDVAELDERGCRVFFIRMPVDGEYKAMELRAFPPRDYWDRLAATFPGRCWNFEDDPATRELGTWDGSHLSSEQAKAYSKWLGAKVAAECAPHD